MAGERHRRKAHLLHVALCREQQIYGRYFSLHLLQFHNHVVFAHHSVQTMLPHQFHDHMFRSLSARPATWKREDQSNGSQFVAGICTSDASQRRELWH